MRGSASFSAHRLKRFKSQLGVAANATVLTKTNVGRPEVLVQVSRRRLGDGGRSQTDLDKPSELPQVIQSGVGNARVRQFQFEKATCILSSAKWASLI
jgi:hypothetical protein